MLPFVRRMAHNITTSAVCGSAASLGALMTVYLFKPSISIQGFYGFKQLNLHVHLSSKTA